MRISFGARVLRSLAGGACTLLSVSVVIFVLTQVLPGDAALMKLGENATDEALFHLREKFGLHEPLYQQYWNWVSGAVQGDLSTSWTLEQPLRDIVAEPLIRSLQLALLGVFAATVVAVPIGIVSASLQGTLFDKGMLSASYLGVSIPDFVLGPLLILAMSLPSFALFPTSGYGQSGDGFWDNLRHLILPTLVISTTLSARIIRQTRTSILEVSNSTYARQARLNGLPERVVLLRHCLPNALTTTIVATALNFGYALGSLVVIEEVFAYPGLGRLFLQAVQSRDVPTVQICALLIACAYIIATRTAEILQAVLNPRLL